MATEEIKKVNSINPVELTMPEIRLAAVAVLAGEYADPDGISETVLKNLTDEYASKSLLEQYKLAKESGNPMRYLCEKFSYPTIRVKGKGDDREIEDSVKQFDLVKANKVINPLSGGIGAKKDWVFKNANFCTTMSFMAAVQLGDEATATFIEKNKDSKKVGELVKAVEDGKNPFTDRKLYEELTGLIQSMLGDEYHPSRFDVNFLKLTFVKDKTGVALATSDHNINGFSKLMMNVCNRIITGAKGYVLDSKAVKKAK